MNRFVPAIIAGCAVVGATTAVVTVLVSTTWVSPAPATVATPEPVVTETYAEPSSVSTTPKPAGFEDGQYVVGIDIPPGTYHITSHTGLTGPTCIIVTLPYKGASLSETTDTPYMAAGSTGYVRLHDKQVIQSTGCTWVLD